MERLEIGFKFDLSKWIRLFNYIVAIIPLLMACFLVLVYISGGWGAMIEGHTPGFYFLKDITHLKTSIGGLALWITLITLIVAGILKTQKYIGSHKLRKLYASILIFVIGFGIRFLLLHLYSEDLIPFSDFRAAWERAKGNLINGRIDYYSLFPAYLNFSLYENLIINIVGEAYIWVLYLNAIYSGITASAIYLITCEITDKESAGGLAGILYALYPANVIYVTTGTPEYIAILFNTLGVLTLIRTIKGSGPRKKCVRATIGGALLGIGGSFKTFSVVIIIAFVMVLAASLLIRRRENAKVEMMLAGVVCALVMGGYKVSSKIICEATSKHFNMEISTETAVPHFMLIGLNTEGEGQIHVGSLGGLYSGMYLSNGMDHETAKDYAYSALKEDWRANSDNIVPNFLKKMIWAWQDDSIPVLYFLEEVGISPDSPIEAFIYESISVYGAGVVELNYLFLMVWATVCAFSYARSKEINFKYEYIALIIFGYFCVILLSESQSRYKCLIMGYVIIMSSLGIERFKNTAHRIMGSTLGRETYKE